MLDPAPASCAAAHHPAHPSHPQADIPARQIRAAYWDNDSKPLLRASWFSKPATALPGGGASGFVPYSETDAAAIEEAYQAALDETVRSLAAGSFLPPSANEGAGGLSASTSASASASCSASGSKGGGSGASRVLLRKEMPLSDGTNKVQGGRISQVRLSHMCIHLYIVNMSSPPPQQQSKPTGGDHRAGSGRLGLRLRLQIRRCCVFLLRLHCWGRAAEVRNEEPP